MPKRCPNGSHRKPPKTGKCVKKTSKKVCPKNKLLNPKTNRCINDTKLNRKKIGITTPSHNITDIITKACSTYNNLKEIDLDKVKFVEGNLVYKKLVLQKIKFISEGTYGKVYLFGNNDKMIAIKTYKHDDDDELGLIDMLQEKKISCNVVNSRVLKIPKGYISIMDIMSGSLKDMEGKLTTKEIFTTIRNVAVNLRCLTRKKLSYTDLKCANILFKCENKKKLKTVIGDIGGICTIGSKHISTYTPYEFKDDRGIVDCNEKSMVWCLGVMILELLQANTDRFHWSIIVNETENSLYVYIEKACLLLNLDKILLKNKMRSDILLKKILDINPKKRIGLTKLINSI